MAVTSAGSKGTSARVAIRLILLSTVVLLLVGICGVHSALHQGSRRRRRRKVKKEEQSTASLFTRPNGKVAPYQSLLPQAEQEKLLHEAKSQPILELFQKASDACRDGQYEECFFFFMTFARLQPGVVEGMTNAGVALERLKRYDQALELYRDAFQKFPDSDKAKSSLLSVLQQLALVLFSKNRNVEALGLYDQICELRPDLVDAFVNKGSLLERLGRFQEAEEIYLKAVKDFPGTLPPLNAMCRILLVEVSGSKSGRFGITQEARTKAFEKSKMYCGTAYQLDPEDTIANMNLGLLYKESLVFDTAIEHLRKAYSKEPNEMVVITNLAVALSREGDVPEAVRLTQKALSLANTSQTQFSLGTLLAPYDRLSEVGRTGHLTGIQMRVDEVNRELVAQGKKARVLRLDWLQSSDAVIDVIESVDFDERFGRPARVLDPEEDKFDVPLSFIDKQTIAIKLTDVYMEGMSGILYTDNEVIAPLGVNSEIPRDYFGQEVVKTQEVVQPVVSIVHQSSSNYYHWTAECLTKIIIALDYYWGEYGVQKEATLLIDTESNFFTAANKIFRFKTPGVTFYTPAAGKRYHFKELHMIHWTQLNTNDPDQNDLWSDYLPSRYALHTLRNAAREHQALRDPPEETYSVVYIARKGVREVIDEYFLIEALQHLLEDQFFYFSTESDSTLTLQRQMDIIGAADIIIGPHGAGLTNIIYAKDSASLVEFVMEPHCNRCFGYLAMSLDIDYWVVPAVSAFYHKKYQLTYETAFVIAQYVQAIMKEKGLDDMLAYDVYNEDENPYAPEDYSEYDKHWIFQDEYTGYDEDGDDGYDEDQPRVNWGDNIADPDQPRHTGEEKEEIGDDDEIDVYQHHQHQHNVEEYDGNDADVSGDYDDLMHEEL